MLKNNKKNVWDIIEEIIRNNVQKQVGKKRMAWLDEINKKYDKKTFKT